MFCNSNGAAKVALIRAAASTLTLVALRVEWYRRMDIARSQLEICRKYRAECMPLDLGLKLGISDNFFSGELPLNGLRHPPERGTCGWYLWAGEGLSDARDFFKPLHVTHLIDRHPEIIRYLGLPPGWRFLVGANYEDAWFDAALLEN